MRKTAYTFNEENIKYLRGILGDEMVDTFLSGIEPDILSPEDQEDYERVQQCL